MEQIKKFPTVEKAIQRAVEKAEKAEAEKKKKEMEQSTACSTFN